MRDHLRPALVLVLLLTLVTGILYPLAVTGVASAAFPREAAGDLVQHDGRIVGSLLIGQDFTSPRYFHPRPSATTAPDPQKPDATVESPYNADNSGGANLGPTSAALVARVRGAVAAWRSRNGSGAVPADAVTTSASGLDPDVSPQTALLQVAAVARARKLPEKAVQALVRSHVKQPILGFIGEPKVNILRLNLALDRLGSR